MVASSRATTGAFVDVVVDERALAKAHARISQYEGRAFRERMERTYRAAASLLVSPIRREIRGSVKGHGENPGMLASKVSVRKGRAPAGYVVRYGTKSRAPHSHLVARGTSRGAHSNPFYERVIAANESRIIEFITENTIKDDVGAEAFTGALRSF